MTVTVTLLALAVLAVFYVSVLFSGQFDFSRWALNIAQAGWARNCRTGGGAWLPFGIGGVLASLPFAVWLFLAIEQLPLAAEESHDPQRDMPKGIIAGILTLIVSAFLVLFLNSGIAPGAFGLAQVRRTAARRLPHPVRRRHRQDPRGAGGGRAHRRPSTPSSSPTGGRSIRSRAPAISRASCR